MPSRAEPVMHLCASHADQGQRPGNKPAQGNALGVASPTIQALKGRDIAAALSGLGAANERREQRG